MLLVIHFFISFLFFKVMPIWLLDTQNTVLGAALMAVASAGCSFGMTFSVNLIGLNWMVLRRNHDRMSPTQRSFPVQTLGPLLVAMLVMSGLSYLITIGFSERLYRQVLYYSSRDHKDLWFFVMALLPLLVHYGILIFDIKRMAAQLELDEDPPSRSHE